MLEGAPVERTRAPPTLEPSAGQVVVSFLELSDSKNPPSDATRRRKAAWMREQRARAYRDAHDGYDEPQAEDVLALLRQVYLDLFPEARASASRQLDELAARHK